MNRTTGAQRNGGADEASLGLGQKPPLYEYFRAQVRQWDSTARQGMPQVADGTAVFTWRDSEGDFPALYSVPDQWLRRALSPCNAPPPPPPAGSALPVPPNQVVRGFALDPSGTRVAALLGPADTELAGLWLLSAGAAPLPLPGPRSWHAAPVWSPDGGSLWVLSGKPPEQAVWRCEFGGSGAAAPPEPLPFPGDLGTPAAGARLRLGIRDGALLLTVRTPGAGSRCWIHREGTWNPATTADPNLDPDRGLEQIAGHKILARAGCPQGDVLAVESPAGTTLTRNGATLWRLEPAEQLTALSVSTHPDGDALWIQSASPELPSGVTCLELPKASGTTTSRPPGKDAGAFVHLRLAIPARDGVMVPVIVSARTGDLAGQLPRSPRPLLLSCYGGFGVVHRTEPEPSVAAWIAAGGIHVAAQVRGGGELGPQWHEAGRGTNKLRAIHDLIDVARYLAEQGWTRVGDLATVGASHGGLVVCAAALLDPGAFGRVIAVAPLLDTVELRRHGLGTQWLHEFGADGETTGQQRAAYSPLHLLAALDSAGHLPPILCCLVGNDERVDNSAAVEFAYGIRRQGGRAWLHREHGGGHAQRAAGSLLDFSATVLSFAAGRQHGMPPG
ncbi:prolyl oligopeptidase family serine peptidase [Paeniglutamicibacter sp. NPDC012692]|uniref:prolyl oligopeptidase family serine peptidase n=1 Tax=Paeniglutamicibacter sp. NPDC012692 TaxID=3364388 RepID=UPI003679BBB5